jgi:LPS export ABC transporter protein LptC
MTRGFNKSGVLLLALLLAAAALTSWLRTRPDIAGPVAEDETVRQIDFFMENFRIRQYDELGRLHYVLKGMRLDHYEEDDRAEISAPDLELAAGDDRQWRMRAERAVTARAPADEIRFLGDVRVEQPGDALMRTGALLVRPDSEYMETLEPVIISGPGGDIEAVSLRGNLQTGVHTLETVKGRYVP